MGEKSAASVSETLKQINATLKQSGGHYADYSCKTVSWDDVQRGSVNGGLSCWGANITDTRLYAKDGRSLFTVRGDNWNERLGKVTADQVAVVGSQHDGPLQPLTLRTFLKNPSQYGKYAGLTDDNLSLSDEILDKEISIRFQTTFLPVDSDERATLEFAPEAYNYNTVSDEDPRNLILLSTTQGLAVQQDGAGAKKLYHHDANDAGTVNRFWLEAERSRHKVGGSQNESKEERDDAVARGKATASVIGVAGMGTRFNVLMTIQIPLEQKKIEREYLEDWCGAGCYEGGICEEWGDDDDDDDFYEEEEESEMIDIFSVEGSSSRGSRRDDEPKIGTSNAARVSRGSYVDTWDGLTVQAPKRHPSEHVTVTIVMYYTCSGGVPSAEDVQRSVDDLENMYRSVESGNLADSTFDFMKSPLTSEDVTNIKTKVVTQPPPKPQAPINYAVFPV